MPQQISRAMTKGPNTVHGKVDQVRVVNPVFQPVPVLVTNSPTPPTSITVKLDAIQFQQILAGLVDIEKVISWITFPPPVQITGGQVTLPPQPSTKE